MTADRPHGQRSCGISRIQERAFAPSSEPLIAPSA